MPITEQSLINICSKKQLRGLPLEEAVKKLTHLNLEGKEIQKIENLSTCVNVSTLYLFDNEIEVIENLGFAKQLQHLYLQNNQIEKMQGMDSMHRLKKLHLNNNNITCVEGLDACSGLEELHLSRQRVARRTSRGAAPEPEEVRDEGSTADADRAALGASASFIMEEAEEPGRFVDGGRLRWDMASIASISDSLRVLELEDCGITTVSHLRYLRGLEHINLSNNELVTVRDSGLDEFLPDLQRLQFLDLRANPLTRLPKYRDAVILLSDCLVTLDDKEVLHKQRVFLHQMRARRAKSSKAKRPPMAAAALDNSMSVGMPGMQ